MGHNCGSNCKRKTGQACLTGRTTGNQRIAVLDDTGKPVKPAGKRAPHATAHEKGAAVDMYFDGLSYRRVAGNMEDYFGRKTDAPTVYRWVRELTRKADGVLRPMPVNTGKTWVADEIVASVGGRN